MQEESMTHLIDHRTDSHEFVTIVDGKESVMRYKIVSSDAKTLDYYHTFVPPELRGHHIAEEIVKFALNYAKVNHIKVIPSCPFVSRYIDSHPEYQALVV